MRNLGGITFGQCSRPKSRRTISAGRNGGACEGSSRACSPGGDFCWRGGRASGAGQDTGSCKGPPPAVVGYSIFRRVGRAVPLGDRHRGDCNKDGWLMGMVTILVPKAMSVRSQSAVVPAPPRLHHSAVWLKIVTKQLPRRNPAPRFRRIFIPSHAIPGVDLCHPLGRPPCPPPAPPPRSRPPAATAPARAAPSPRKARPAPRATRSSTASPPCTIWSSRTRPPPSWRR